MNTMNWTALFTAYRIKCHFNLFCRETGIMDKHNIFWSSLKGVPQKCKWPVQVIDWWDGREGEEVTVYCHSDAA